jgi:hypothetical protein
MDLRDGHEALIASTPEEFAAAVVRLYTDESLWGQIAANGIAHIEHRYTPEVVSVMLRRLLTETGALPA